MYIEAVANRNSPPAVLLRAGVAVASAAEVFSV